MVIRSFALAAVAVSAVGALPAQAGQLTYQILNEDRAAWHGLGDAIAADAWHVETAEYIYVPPSDDIIWQGDPSWIGNLVISGGGTGGFMISLTDFVWFTSPPVVLESTDASIYVNARATAGPVSPATASTSDADDGTNRFFTRAFYHHAEVVMADADFLANASAVATLDSDVNVGGFAASGHVSAGYAVRLGTEGHSSATGESLRSGVYRLNDPSAFELVLTFASLGETDTFFRLVDEDTDAVLLELLASDLLPDGHEQVQLQIMGLLEVGEYSIETGSIVDGSMDQDGVESPVGGEALFDVDLTWYDAAAYSMVVPEPASLTLLLPALTVGIRRRGRVC